MHIRVQKKTELLWSRTIVANSLSARGERAFCVRALAAGVASVSHVAVRAAGSERAARARAARVTPITIRVDARAAVFAPRDAKGAACCRIVEIITESLAGGRRRRGEN